MFQVCFHDRYFFTLLNDLSVILEGQGEANSEVLRFPAFSSWNKKILLGDECLGLNYSWELEN